MSRNGYMIMYAGYPIFWASKLQTEIALSTTEAEYIALSQALREVIPLVTLMEEIHPTFPVNLTQPFYVCKVHEDNQPWIKLANSETFRTKHIALKCHYFKSYYVKQDKKSPLTTVELKIKNWICWLNLSAMNFSFDLDICSMDGNNRRPLPNE